MLFQRVINERIQREKEKNDKEEAKETRKMLKEVLKVMKTLQKQDLKAIQSKKTVTF
jgi:hypothetical protein